MACEKLGSKPDGFQRRGQAWFCTTGLPSDIIIEVEEMSFHLHKFPLMSRSGKLSRLISETPDDDEEGSCHFTLPDIPGGPDAFELAAKFCYGVKLELTPINVTPLRCAAEYLEMTEDILNTDGFLNHVVLRSWKDSVRTLQSCECLMPVAEDLQIVKKCVDSIAMKACTDPSLFGWPMTEGMGMQGMQSPREKPKGAGGGSSSGSGWNFMSKKFGCKFRMQVCDSQERTVVDGQNLSRRNMEAARRARHRRNSSLE